MYVSRIFLREPGQAGSALLVVIVLLLLASIVTMFSVGVGTFEQRASANDVRAKLVQQVADAALAQGGEVILADTSIFQLGSNWELCTAADTSFPCGAAPCPDASSVATCRRATMYRYIGGAAATDVFGDGAGDAMDKRMLPMARSLATVNNTGDAATDGVAVNYGVGALWCRLSPASITATESTCSTNAATSVRVHAVTLVAVAAIGAEGARATAVKSFATNSTFSLSADTPPLLASGPIEIRGNLQVVTSPNAGGVGVPVSVWSRRPLDAGGTPDTCYADEFFRSGSPTWAPVGADAADQILRCDSCNCGGAPLTGGHGNSCIGGMDILANPSACGPNQAVQPAEFPCDLFAHIFGVQAWKDLTSPVDNFCETRITVEDPEDSTKTIGADENYLATKADFIITSVDEGTFGERFDGDSRVISCGELTTKLAERASATGKGALVWVRTGECGDGLEIGTPTAPVMFVHDGTPGFQNITLFGVIFVRSTGAAPLDPATGGSATFSMNGGSAVYGSIIVQGEMEKVNGTAAVVFDSKVLGNLINDLDEPDVFGLPGSWSDTVRY